ncbi:MAG: hypothetical protein E6Q83_04065 [Thiothrix sp.]|nr:MAG: hypothetical protein E6Q83_04065 [Thiothrix sp.]
MLVKNTQLEIMQRQLEQHRSHEQRGLLLLKLGFLLTFLLYLLFNQHLYLGDALSWSAYFKDAASLFGFAFTVSIVILMALFLSWVKHHAYLHFGFFGSVALVVTTVIGFALFAEFFSSSANQDVKASVLLERNSAYQSTLSHDTTTSAPNTGLVSAIAQAEQTLARCEEKLKAGKEKHCNGDRAKVAALRNSEQSANKAQAEASIERDKLKYERQDELKAQSYNPVILTLARVLAGETGDYKDYLKTAVVLITLFVAVCFEILHHFLSKTHGVSVRAIEGLELAIAKEREKPESFAQSSVNLVTEKQPIGFALPAVAPMTAQAELKPVLFKYQTEAKPVEHQTKATIGFTFPPASTVTAKQSAPSTMSDFGQFRARRDVFASPSLSDSETLLKPLADGLKTGLDPEPSQTVSTPLANGQNGLYGEWLKAVNSGECLPSVKPTWLWIQKRISNKETGSRTHDRTRISNMQKAFFARAMKEGLMVANPNYTNGGKKYLWIA